MPRVAMFGGPRSGSTTLVQYFRAVGVRIADEPLHPGILRGRPFDMAAELARLYGQYDALKHLYSHLSTAQNLEFLRYHREHGYRVLYLKRHDRVRQAVSEALAMSTGFWEVEPGEREAYARRVSETRLPIEAIRGALDWTARHEAAYDPVLTGPLVHTAYYEDLYAHGLEDTVEAVASICTFLGTPPPTAATDPAAVQLLGPGRKQNSAEIYRLIPNRQEIEQHFGVSLLGEGR